MSTTFGVAKGDLIASLGELVHSGTATTGSASTLVDTNSLTHPDDFFNDHWVYIYEGTGLGQERRVTDFDQATSTLTVSPNWATNPNNTSKYYIYGRRFNNAAYEAGFKQALGLLKWEYLLKKELQTTDLGDPILAATYEISVPAGFAAIREIWREHETTDDLFPYYWPGPGDSDTPFWTIHGSAGSRKIKIDKARADANGQVVKGRALRIVGQAFETEPTANGSTLTIDVAPVIELAALLLGARDIKQPDIAYIWLSRLRGLLAQRGSGLDQGSVIIDG